MLLEASRYSLLRGDGVPVFSELDFTLRRGEILGVVGESGSGKSQLLLSLLGLAMSGASVAGSCRFDGGELAGMDERGWQTLRGRRIAMLFQDPMLSWNPYLTIGAQLNEVLQLHSALDKSAAASRAMAALEAVGLAEPRALLDRYPHELSGGMRQRAMLAMALLAEPDLLLADEPTTALDAGTQIAVLDLLADLRARKGLTILLVTHDLGVVARIADRIMVMRAGHIEEQGATDAVLSSPASDYGRALLAAARAMEAP